MPWRRLAALCWFGSTAGLVANWRSALEDESGSLVIAVIEGSGVGSRELLAKVEREFIQRGNRESCCEQQDELG